MAKVTYGNIEVDFRRPTNADAFRREQIVSRLGADDEGMRVYHRIFGRLVTQATASKNLPFKIPDTDATDEDLEKAFNSFFQMDEDFTDRCYETFIALSKPVDEATGPEPLPKDAPKNS